jgi:hypothetical protein
MEDQSAVLDVVPQEEAEVVVSVPAIPATARAQQRNASDALLAIVQIAEIETHEQYLVVGGAALDARAGIKAVEALFKPQKVAMDSAKKVVLSQEKEYIAPFEEVKALADGLLKRYDVRREAERRAEEARLRAEAQKQAEDMRIAEAAAVEASGDKEAAEAIISAPIEAVAPIVVKEETAPGVSMRDNWVAEVHDVLALLRAIIDPANTAATVDLISPNMPALNQMAKALKSNLNIPGVKAVNNRVVAGRTK